MEKVAFTLVHTAAHVLLYAIPRILWTLCVGWPSRVLSRLFRVRLSRCDPRDERHVRILGPVGRLASSESATTRERLGIADAQLANHGLRHGTHDAAVDSVEPAWLRYDGPLYNGHVHTILGALRPPLDLRAPQREVVPSYDGNPTCLDWWLPTPAEAKGVPVRALVIILPGLTGSSKAFYVRRVARQLLAANMAVCVLNARGVADTPLEKPQLFSALFTKDVRCMMETYLTRDKVEARLLNPVRPAELPGEVNKESGFDAVYAITSPHNLCDGAAALRKPLTAALYNSTLYGGLRSYYERHKHVAQQLPGLNKELLFSGQRPLIDRMRTVQDFDDYITGPHFGFADAETYYSHANNFNRLHFSRTPQVCLVAANDPICGAPQPDSLWMGVIEKHRAGLVYVEMPVGGHLGFLGSPYMEWKHAPNEMEKFLLYSMTHFIE